VGDRDEVSIESDLIDSNGYTGNRNQ
jgi:hypothetical protein